MIEVREFITRLEQGYTEAFLCRAADGHTYVAKSVQAGRETLVRECISGQIGRALNVSIPPFERLYCAPSVARQSLNPELAHLVSEPPFGSRFVDGVPTLNVADVVAIDEDVRRLVLLFDWWVFNEDRTDDNPNLLWDPAVGALHVIDHNLAFSPRVGDPAAVQEFWSRHLFRQSREGMGRPDFRAVMFGVMGRILDLLPAWWAALPDEWTGVCELTLESVVNTLDRCRSDDFWVPK